MTTLVLVRHAKSDWGDQFLADHDRPLNDRGMRDAPIMAERLAATGFRPGAILSSTALRAARTAAFFSDALGAPVVHQERLYGAAAPTLLAAAVDSGAPDVVVIAHDPGMSVLAAHLSDDGIGHMPTCAVARFAWRTEDWDVAAAVAPDDWSFDSPR